jgi:anti-sigma B factor antagonist
MAGGVPVVAAPAEIDTTSAGQLRAVLFEWQTQGYTTVVVDLTGTQFCDSTGLRELVWAHKRAVADGGGLRLVTRAEGAFARIFTVTGLAGILPRYQTVQQALGQAPATTARRPSRGTAAGPAAAPDRAGDHGGLIVDGRNCEQCGAAFVPRREHARFCSPACRAAWNREHLGDPAVQASALSWSLAAMSEATALLPAAKPRDLPQAFAAIGEAVWWITMVDATLLRHHPAVYDSVLAARTPAARTPAGRQLIVETLAGLRFVRNWISRETGLQEAIDASKGWRITGWTWKPASEPALAWLPPPAQAWELTRHRAYQARLAGHTIGTTFGNAVTFLAFTGADAASITDTSGTRPPTASPPAQAGDLGSTANL